MALVAAPDSEGVPGDEGGSGKLSLGPDEIRLAGIRSEVAAEGGVARKLRVQGFVVPDPTRERHVVSRIGGWLERLHVKASGALVKRGDPLYTIHAPDLVPLQEQYAYVLRSRNDGQSAGSDGGGEARLEVVRQRMRVYDLPGTLTAALERGEEPTSSITFPARGEGYVRFEQLFEGRQVEPNTDMMTITGLSVVWIEADFFEADIAGLSVGLEVAATSPSLSGWQGRCRIAAIAPSLDPVKGTLRVWAACPNEDLALKPGMTAVIEAPMTSMHGVLVPSSAVLNDGAVPVVYLESVPGQYERREVETGLRDGTTTQILEGIDPGDRVVTRGAFLIDAERRLRARARGTAGTPGAGDAVPVEARRVVEVSLGSLEVPLRASGRVAAIPDRVHHVVVRTMAWVETLNVKVTGTRVQAGDPLFALDAPELVPIQEEYLLALSGATRPAGPGTGVEGALGRLKRHGLQDSFIADLKRRRQAQYVVPFVSPIAGFVTLGDVYESQRVEPGMELMVVTDLSQVWVEAAVFPAGAATLEGRKAEVSLLHDPGALHQGSVIGVDPFLDTASRAMTVRVLCPNEDLALRPGMTALVDLGAESFAGIIVPAAAVVDTGVRQVAFVQDAVGRFQPRDVTVGARGGDRIQVLSGLQAGERIAASGSFLLDPDATVPRGAPGAAGDDRGVAR